MCCIIPVRYGYVMVFVVSYQSNLYFMMQKLPPLGKVSVILIWTRMVLTQRISWVHKIFVRLDIHIKYQYVIGTTMLIPIGMFFLL